VRVTTVDPGMVETDFSSIRFRGDEARAAKVYAGLTPLTPADVAETIVWTASRPAHVNIARVLLTSIDQANSLLLNRKS
jgi:3-hydroxy acid dehydrogenase/malonic semialdehyde reductase